MENDGLYNNLRKKLEVLGYNQPLPGLALVGALFQDLITTTESLRDCKQKIQNLLEEKSCWKLGIEPYKCDNSRLLTESNQLHYELIRQREKFEEQVCEFTKKIRNLESDKNYLEEHCSELESHIKSLVTRFSDDKTVKSKKNGLNMNKKPAFVTTVRSGVYLRNSHDEKCSKCNSILWSRPGSGSNNADGYCLPNPYDFERLQNNLKENIDQLAHSKKTIDDRDREISRLNELLSGGRPPAALAKDCCYKNVGTLSEDIELLQREKSDNIQQLRECQESMHEAKQRAVDLSDRNKRMQKELDELKKTALFVESEANEEIGDREKEISELKEQLTKYKIKVENLDHNKNFEENRKTKPGYDDKRKLHERLNELTMREQELTSEVDKVQKKNLKLKTRLNSMQKESEERISKEEKFNDEERIRLKSERDFFQKEYLNLIHRAGSEKEIEYLQLQIQTKDDELRSLRCEVQQCRKLHQNPCMNNYENPPSSSGSCSSAVQATILRVERERDLVKSDLERVKIERDSLHDRLKFSTQNQLQESHNQQEKIEELKCNISVLEKDKRELESAHIPGQTHIVLMKEEIEQLKKRMYDLQGENCKLKSSYTQIKTLHDQTEKALVEVQNKYVVTETQLENAETRLSTLGSHRETAINEVGILKNEIVALKSINKSIESEKEKIMSELDTKTEKVYRLESDFKTLTRKHKELEKFSKEYQEKYEKVASERKNCENELHETSFESKSLRQQVATLKTSRDQIIAENGRIINELAEKQAEIVGIKNKFKDAENEVDHLRKQLQQYVSEVKKAEELLMAKEKERDEMLEHYRSLSHDAVLLEGNNQSLEVEAAEHKRQLNEAEIEISKYQVELCTKNQTIECLEKQVNCLSAQISNLEKELEQSYDDQRLIKIDLDAMKELCDKLDLQRDKLNAELEELGLERENESLRRDTDRSNSGRMVTSSTAEKLLDRTRYELEDARQLELKRAQEVIKLKEKNEELEIKLNQERDKCYQKEALAKEYNIQLQELRHTLTDDRFRAAQNRDQFPKTM